ncbi:uncharacterized protein LOC113295041 [Papaver somniferum]|uniref:uncharacterized protein LOC113295041 n=1 Tax=Papaver somniferum TaxID=3469 RepID=UPI000E701EDB|nr:uncharacterized protein LOC113295041 [Papaver somniferum]
MTIIEEVQNLKTSQEALTKSVDDFMHAMAESHDDLEGLDTLFTRLQTSNTKNMVALMDDNRRAMATMMQANKQDITSLGDTIARSMTQLLLARFPINTTPPGFNTNTNGNIGTTGLNNGSLFDNNSGIRAASINLKFPTFDGTDPAGWIFQSDQYFRLHNIAEALKIPLATAHFTGEANAWYKWIQGKLTDPFWLHFCSRICDRFADRKFANPRMALSSMSQKGSVRDHISEFEEILNFVTDFPEDYIVDLFIKSLKPEIRSMVEVLEPQTLFVAFKKALKQEDVLIQTSSSYKTARPNPFRQALNAQQFRKSAIPPGAKRLSLEEQREKRDKGLCFNCDQLYVPGHLCAKPRLLIMDMAPNNDDNSNDYYEEEVMDDTTINTADVNKESEISLHSLMGSSFPKTMRLTGYIKGEPLTVLIDSGSTHNFLHPYIATKHGFSTKPSGTALNVMVVLGVQWLQTLGEHMKFHLHNTDYLLVGNSSALIMLMNSSPLQRFLDCAHNGFLLQLTPNLSTTPSGMIPTEVSELLFRYSDIFEPPSSLPPSRDHDHRISLLPNTAPVNVRPYKYPHFQKAEIEKIVSELKQAGFIRQSSNPYSSPVLLVQKKDNSWRIYVDYRALNKVTVNDRFLIPVVDELIDEMNGAIIFSKVDMRFGFHQIRLFDADIHKTAFIMHDGHYEFLVMPFGLSNAPATFQSLMNDVFRPYLRKFVLVFFDDILIYSKSLAEHLKHLKIVFELLRTDKLFLKKYKCDFAKTSIGYLGHTVSAEGVAVEEDKISTIKNWPIPSTIKDLRGFLGLACYYREFVRDYGKICVPLTKLLKQDAFKWPEQATYAFNQLKFALTSTPVLALPDFTKEFCLECDASGNGLGAVLMQSNKPIAYFSKPLSGKNLNLSVYDKEMLAIVSAVNKCSPYLLGRHFKIYTDHRSLKYFLEQILSSLEQQKWLSKLLGYDYEIVYKCGTANRVVYALSRLANPQLLAITTPIFSGINGIVQECHADAVLGRIVVVSTSEWCNKLLYEFHSTPLGGHSASAPPGLLQPLSIPTDVWIDISMDFIDGFPLSNRNNSILVVVDHLSKYAHFIALSHPYYASTIADVFIREIVRLHGMPKTITSDRDPIFMSQFWEAFFSQQDTQLCRSSAYHPQTDGQTEVTNRTLEFYLHCFTGIRKTDWFKWLTWAEWWYKTSYHSSIKMTPYQDLYCRAPPTISTYLPGTTLVHVVDELLRARDYILRILHSNVHDAQARMKTYAEIHRTERYFAVNDWVFLRIQPYRQTTGRDKTFSKLSPKFYGPFHIVEKIDPVAYRLDLPETSRIHPVFYVSQLKLKLGSSTVVNTVLPITVDYEKWEPEKILDRKMFKKGDIAGTRWLIKWKDRSNDEATWEDANVFLERFPEFQT